MSRPWFTLGQGRPEAFSRLLTAFTCGTTFGVVPSPKSGNRRAPRAPGPRGSGRAPNACLGHRRLGCVVAVAVVIAGLSAPAMAQAQEVVANCDFPGGRDHCNRWYSTSEVTISWDWDLGGSPDLFSGCTNAKFTGEMKAVERSCTVDWSGSTQVRKKVWIGIDRTPPSVVSFNPERPPDHNGWFNHPVGLTFQGTDAVSGIASCSSTIFAGPEGQGIPVGGVCTDHAGHSAAGMLPVNYDATPPSPPAVGAMPGNRKVRLRWTRSPDTSSEVVRLARRQPPVMVYQGLADRFTDRSLRNERRYRYVVTLIDQAGNRSAGTTSTIPTASRLLLPSRGERVEVTPDDTSLPVLVWKPVRRARYYNVQVFRGQRKVLSSWPERARQPLKRRWTDAGRSYRLVEGRYCWHVWPGYGKRSERRYGKRLGSSCFRIIR